MRYITKSIRYDVYSALLSYCGSKSIKSFNECLEHIINELCETCLEHARWEMEFRSKLAQAKSEEERAEIVADEMLRIVEKYKKSVNEYKELVDEIKKRVHEVIRR